MRNLSTEHTLILPWVERATDRFVFAHEMREAFSLALVAGVNLIFSGPGGHAKSEFLAAAMGAVSNATPYVKSFGQGTSSEEIYGGIDLDAMNGRDGQKATFRYNAGESFLDAHLAVFEELFDAPPRVLTSLKDTLTARELRNGTQRHSMKTTMIAAATNHSPQEIAEGGPEIAALVERFPVQLEVKWNDYSEDAFMEMFGAVLSETPSEPEKVDWEEITTMQKLVADVQITPSMQRVLARILVDLRQDKVTISPRTAMLAVRLTRAAAIINGRGRVTTDDIGAIVFLPGVHRMKDRVHELISEYAQLIVNDEAMDDIADRIEELVQYTGDLDSHNRDQLNELLSLWSALESEIYDLPYGSSQQERRRQLMSTISGRIEAIRNAHSAIDRAEREAHEKARQVARQNEQNTSRLKHLVREAKTYSNKMWKSRGEERELLQIELHDMQDEIYAMELSPNQSALRDQALNSIERALKNVPSN
jgi:hypothetical protein